MRVIVNTDHHPTASGELAARVEADVAASIDRFLERGTRIAVHLNDENSGKGGAADEPVPSE
jgi:hypothetical protein